MLTQLGWTYGNTVAVGIKKAEYWGSFSETTEDTETVGIELLTYSCRWDETNKQLQKFFSETAQDTDKVGIKLLKYCGSWDEAAEVLHRDGLQTTSLWGSLSETVEDANIVAMKVPQYCGSGD